MYIARPHDQPDRSELSWEKRWKDVDLGIIASWERGRNKKSEDPSLALRASAGELPVLPWKGGVERKIQGSKYGTFLYLAMWQGLRGESLQIETNEELILTCSRTGVQVTFTADESKYRELE